MKSKLEVVQIYFNTATYDEIERDVKVILCITTRISHWNTLGAQVTLESALGLIGGTMGLLTGFSILSGVEIIYFVIKFFFSLRLNRINLQNKK